MFTEPASFSTGTDCLGSVLGLRSCKDPYHHTTMIFWSKKSWASLLLLTTATLFTEVDPAALPRAVLHARDGLKAGMGLGQLVAAIIDYLKDANAYVCICISMH